MAVISDDKSRRENLSKMAVTDVWGIGTRLGNKLKQLNIQSALDLANQNSKAMRRIFSVVVERSVNELDGVACLSLDEVKQIKKEIFSRRSFGERVTDITPLKAALVTHAAIVARKLRRQHSLTKRIGIFAASSHMKKTITKSRYCMTLLRQHQTSAS